jgi:hypothetical protein
MYTEFLGKKSLGKCPCGELQEYERITQMDLRVIFRKHGM